jgi:branched-chain amino acid transport system ATP-binding protein
VTTGDGSGPILAVRNLEVVYGAAIQVLRGVSLEVQPGKIVTLLGANGAGKTSLLRAVSGLLKFHRGSVPRGTVEFNGRRIDRLEASAIVRGGMAQVMEGRRIFAELTVDENLKAGAYSRRDRGGIKDSYDKVLELFPVLKERHRQTAGYLSGGEQQMVAMARAMMAAPKLLLLDEPSLGLAPLIVQQIRDLIAEINREGTSVLLVEQNATMALSIADHGYVMANGAIVKDGPAQAMLGDSDIQEFYLGVGEAGHHSFRDLKSYRRRKRWTA